MDDRKLNYWNGNKIMKPSFTLSPTMAQHLKPSPTLYINERVQEMWAQGETVYHMGFGESRFPVHPKLQLALRDNAYQKSYLAGQGLRELRVKVAEFYTRQFGRPIKPEQIMTGPGSKSLIYALQMALNAELILPTPSWVSYAPQARLLQRPVRYIPALPAEGYELTIEALDQTLHKSDHQTKVLLITSPNNPTGRMYEPEFLQELADYCRKQALIVLCDEIYGLVPHGHIQHVSLAHYYPEGTVVLGGVSKHLSLGGWRLGTAVVPDHEEGRVLMTAMRAVAGEIWSSSSAPVQYAAIEAYDSDPDILNYIEECTRIHSIRTQYVWQALMRMEINCPQPAGGFYMFPNFDEHRDALNGMGIYTSEDLADYLLDEYQIATLPGTAFGTPAADLSLRLSTSYLDMENDEKAAALLNLFRKENYTPALMESAHPMMNEALQRLGAFVNMIG